MDLDRIVTIQCLGNPVFGRTILTTATLARIRIDDGAVRSFSRGLPVIIPFPPDTKLRGAGSEPLRAFSQPVARCLARLLRHQRFLDPRLMEVPGRLDHHQA
jgi:hypothetical protein